MIGDYMILTAVFFFLMVTVSQFTAQIISTYTIQKCNRSNCKKKSWALSTETAKKS